MASISIQGRVDGELWEGLKEDGETNTLLLQRLTTHYAATSADKLTAIAPTPDAAIAVLLNSHKLLNQLIQNAAVALPEMPAAAPTEPTTTTTEPTESATCYDDEF